MVGWRDSAGEAGQCHLMPALMDAIRKEKLKVCDATGLHQLRGKLRVHCTCAVRTRSAAAERLESSLLLRHAREVFSSFV